MPEGDTLGRLDGQASDFADLLTGLLNATITTGCSVTSFTRRIPGRDRTVAIVAPGAAETAPDPPDALVPLSIAEDPELRNEAPLWINFAFRMVLDDERTYTSTSP